MTKQLKNTPGKNIAMKVLPHKYEATVQFYRNLLCLRRMYQAAQIVGEHAKWHVEIHCFSNVFDSENMRDIICDLRCRWF